MAEDAVAPAPVLSTWTIYDHPRDAPKHFVARRFEISAGSAVATDDVFFHAHSADPLRTRLQAMGLVRLERNPEDDPCVMETWI